MFKKKTSENQNHIKIQNVLKANKKGVSLHSSNNTNATLLKKK